MKEGSESSFLNEAALLEKLSHPNVVKYFGIHTTITGEQYIVMEYLPLGSLNDLLMKQKQNISNDQLIDMARQAATGMVYLESSKVIHRDLALRNILVTQSKEKKWKICY